MKTAFYFSSIFTFLLLCTGCNNKIASFQGNYPENGYEYKTPASKDLVWDKLIDFFTAKGIAIKTLDKNSGVITSDQVSFINSYTWENKYGAIVNSNALVLCSRLRGPFTFGPLIKPESITGQWIMRIKESNGNTFVVINLANAEGKITYENLTVNPPIAKQTYNLLVKSTGVLEKSLQEVLNKM